MGNCGQVSSYLGPDETNTDTYMRIEVKELLAHESLGWPSEDNWFALHLRTGRTSSTSEYI